MSLAETRAPRSNAGGRLWRLLQAEEEDHFYSTTYGGFQEESGDEEYNTEQSDSEDEVDSDFDIDEGDEPDSAPDDEEPRRKRRVITKVYKEPVKPTRLKPRVRKLPGGAGAPEKVSTETGDLADTPDDSADLCRKSVRRSTTEHTRLTYLRVQERQVQPRRLRRPAHALTHTLSQAELLAEAKITEEINVRSLENYERLEADKKRQVLKKRRCGGPTVRFHSLSVPLLAEGSLKEETVDVEGLDQEPLPPVDPSPVGRCLRNFVTFSDEATFERWFPRPCPSRAPAARELCPVTHRPALYRDPVTDIPYANARAFKIIREAYRKYVAAHGLPGAGAGAGNANAGPTAAAGHGTTANAGLEQAARSRQRIIIKQAVTPS